MPVIFPAAFLLVDDIDFFQDGVVTPEEFVDRFRPSPQIDETGWA
jgi:hypothetical protein